MRRNAKVDLYKLIVEETNREFNIPPCMVRGDVLLNWLDLEGVRVSRRTVEIIKRVWGDAPGSGHREAIIAGALRKMFALFDAYGDDLAALSAALADALLPALLVEGDGLSDALSDAPSLSRGASKGVSKGDGLSLSKGDEQGARLPGRRRRCCAQFARSHLLPAR